MSKLADAIRRSQRVESSPMGFGAARPAQRPSMLVGYIGAASGAAAAKDAGAEFLMLDGASDIAAARASAGDLPLGVAGASDAASAEALRKGGADFLLVTSETSAAALLDEDSGYVLTLPSDADEATLRALDALSLEAVYLGELKAPFTVGRQVEVARAGLLTRKPPLARVKSDISKEDVQCLRAAGIVGLVTDQDGIAALKATVASLPPRRTRRDDRPVVSLPRGGPAEEHDDEDDE